MITLSALGLRLKIVFRLNPFFINLKRIGNLFSNLISNFDADFLT
jgi:hypothetical protein